MVTFNPGSSLSREPSNLGRAGASAGAGFKTRARAMDLQDKATGDETTARTDGENNQATPP